MFLPTEIAILKVSCDDILASPFFTCKKFHLSSKANKAEIYLPNFLQVLFY